MIVSTSTRATEAFIARWQGQEGGQERANYGMFLTELCDLIEVGKPQPAGATHEHNDYVFERAVTRHKDQGDSTGRIDLYKRNSFVLEAKQSRMKGAKQVAGQDSLFDAPDGPLAPARGRRSADRAWDVLMLNAKHQAEDYARALPASHGWPPFILVCDVGHCIEVYADFTGQGKNYTQYPDRQSFRIYLEDLREPDVRERLQKIWDAPLTLDPALASAKVTRDIAKRLAQVSLALEKKKYPAEDVAMFLMRCLFTMFAESVGLLPKSSFKDMLEACEQNPKRFVPEVTQLWEAMDLGTWAHALKAEVKKFNGEFFKNRAALPLGREEIGELRRAAGHNWTEVDPSIFGTLVEQALDPVERRRLGAHYTPRAYVERLVVATVIEPLREDWATVVVTADKLRLQAERDAQLNRPAADKAYLGARTVVKNFHEKLCLTRVLDPACGTGNFLYVALEQMKRLEGEVLELLQALGGQESIEWLDRQDIDPHQFLGLEINPRAAAIAELVLWIGYLQWHFRTKGGAPEEPILKAFKNIEVRNAVLTWDGAPLPKIVAGRETYPNARRADWPMAEFIVGNPPFIGGKDIRARVNFAEQLWAAHKHMNESADFVMYWWDHAAELLTSKGTVLRRFGLVTTNSISQVFQRKVIERHMTAKTPISILMAVADHPWTKVTKDAAAVRIAMTVCAAGTSDGVLREVTSESGLDTDTPAIEFWETKGSINSDLTTGVDVTKAIPLKAQESISSPGMKLHGAGFIVSKKEASHLGLDKRPGLAEHIRPYRNGRDLAGQSRGAYVIDLFGLTSDDVRRRFPEVYQHISETIKPERDKNNRETYRSNWWIFGEPRRELRPALATLPRYITTIETAKHRIFQFLDVSILPDNKLLAIALNDAADLGVLSSNIHFRWYIANSAKIGIYEGDAVYVKSRCFDPFPFPDANNIQKHIIREIAEELDAHRKRVLDEHPHLTLTGLYNVLEKLRAGTSPADLNAKDRRSFDDGLVLNMKELHGKLDAAVSAAYGWPADVTDDEILTRLVALNKVRATEEKAGLIRWLRPDYQIPRFGKGLDKQAAAEDGAQIAATLNVVSKAQLPKFPTGAVEQTAAVFAALADSIGPLGAAEITARFRYARNNEKKIAAVLGSLDRLAYVSTRDGVTFALRRVA